MEHYRHEESRPVILATILFSWVGDALVLAFLWMFEVVPVPIFAAIALAILITSLTMSLVLFSRRSLVVVVTDDMLRIENRNNRVISAYALAEIEKCELVDVAEGTKLRYGNRSPYAAITLSNGRQVFFGIHDADHLCNAILMAKG